MPEISNIKSEIYIGTSGYSYQDWRNIFYPSDIPADQMLPFYAQHFNIVEINATYYKIPGYKAFDRMAQRTPDTFHFIVKTHQETTHRRKENRNALLKLEESIKPLIDSNKFRGYLAQFPYSFKNSEHARKYLVNTKKIIGDHTLFVEFRNDSWSKNQVYDFLKINGIGYVNVDQPQLKGLLPPQDINTNPWGYIRFHGRNANNWWEGQGSARYDYEYNTDELKEWLVNISSILRKTFKTYIFFNNHPNGQAIKNAKQMIEILKKASLV